MGEFEKNKNHFFEIAQKIIDTDKLSHAYLIEIFAYETDFQNIKDFVKLVLCKNKDKQFSELNCENCNICSLVDAENYPDMQIIEPDGKEIKKAQILAVQNEFNNKSLLGNKRIYIIKEAEKLNVSAANTILKFLEEPEDNIVAILVTKNRYKVIETILSRCQILSLNFPTKTLDIDEDVIRLIDYIYNSENVFLKYSDIYTNIIQDKTKALECFSCLSKVLLLFLECSSSGDFSVLSRDILNILSKVDQNKLVRDILFIQESLEKLSFNVNYKLWLDALFAKMIGGARND